MLQQLAVGKVKWTAPFVVAAVAVVFAIGEAAYFVVAMLRGWPPEFFPRDSITHVRPQLDE